jgi:uncharacterized damage-inducible protein DinB
VGDDEPEPVSDRNLVTMRPLDERMMLRRWLDFHRVTLVSKVQGVESEGLAFTPVGTGTSLGGLIRHVTVVEEYWFGVIFSGKPAPRPQTDPWEHDGGLSGDELIVIFNQACERNRLIEQEAGSLDQLAAGPVSWAAGSYPSLRWIMNHMIGEEARHNGHADLLREMVDGSVGL